MQNQYSEQMRELVNITSGCHPMESYTEHFEEREVAEDALEDLDVRTEKDSAGLFPGQTLYCGRKSN